jgi:hypothetical protein
MAKFPASELRFDAAIGLTSIRAQVAGGELDEALKHARAAADRDADNPLRALYASDADAGRTADWEVPDAGAQRANVNRVLAEAAYCASNGLRSATLDYIDGPMRDGAGFQTTHALWALVIARDRGCLAAAEFNRRAGPLVAELRGGADTPGSPAQDVDLFAERTLMIELAGAHDGQVTRRLEALLAAQSPDGAWGAVSDAGAEPPYFRFHATMSAAWALAASL